jgi:hypothetical protein
VATGWFSRLLFCRRWCIIVHVSWKWSSQDGVCRAGQAWAGSEEAEGERKSEGDDAGRRFFRFWVRARASLVRRPWKAIVHLEMEESGRRRAGRPVLRRGVAGSRPPVRVCTLTR